MNGAEVYRILVEKGVNSLCHANTVTTACAFLQVKGLASRGYIEERGLQQTPQYSDDRDKLLSIWHDIFLDGVDLHERGRVRNNYGPVLFVLPTSILLNLPPKTEVLVTRDNPVHWSIDETTEDRYFMLPEQLCDSYTYGDFNKHITLRTKYGILPFDGTPLDIVLDDPMDLLPNGDDAYTSAVECLENFANEGGLSLNIRKRRCRNGCRCLAGHRYSYEDEDIGFWFRGRY